MDRTSSSSKCTIFISGLCFILFFPPAPTVAYTSTSHTTHVPYGYAQQGQPGGSYAPPQGYGAPPPGYGAAPPGYDQKVNAPEYPPPPFSAQPTTGY